MSTDQKAVIYGVVLNRATVFNIISQIENSSKTVEELLQIQIDSEQIFDFSIEEFNLLLQDLGADTMYSAHSTDEPAYIGVYLGDIADGSLPDQISLFEERKICHKSPYENSSIKEFLPEPELCVLSYST